jgi:pimeloyl-ACP methyl ester carboxylesterase
MMRTSELTTRLQQYNGLRIDSQNVLPLSEDSWWVTLNPDVYSGTDKLEGSGGASDSVSGKDSLEGKLHLPADRATRLIIFEPGFPGGASTDFERLHIRGLLSAGYAVFVARHRGTIINGKYSEYYINCAKRQEKATLENQKVLGNGHASFDDWLREPLIALNSLSTGFEEIFLVGHSFGGLAVLSSATTFFQQTSEHGAKVKKIVSLAGVGGKIRAADDRILKRWDEYFYSDWGVLDRVEIGELAENIGYIQYAHEHIHNHAHVIPKSVHVICLTAYGDTAESVDELISPLEALDVIVSVGHGTLVIDTTQRPDPEAGKLSHELEALKTSDLLKLIDPDWKPTQQIVRIDAQGIR